MLLIFSLFIFSGAFSQVPCVNCFGPRQQGCKDLTVEERGLIRALKNMGYGYRKIALGLDRSATTIFRFLKNLTYQKPGRTSGKGRGRISTPAQDAHAIATFLALRKLNTKKRETTARLTRAASGFPGSLRTIRRRLLPRKKERPREKPTVTSGDMESREAWCRAQVMRPIAFWTDDVIFIDCKAFYIALSQNQLDYQRQKKVRFVIRTKSEGLLPECVKPGAAHRVSSSGTAKIFMAAWRGEIVSWIEFRKWNARTYTRCLNSLRNAMRERGVQAPWVLVHDNDPSLKSKKGLAHAARRGFQSLPLPCRSPDLMPHDFSLWARICADMQAFENARPADAPKEKGEAYRERLRDTALALPHAYIRSVLGKVHSRAGEIINRGGGYINEGTKRTGER